VDGPSTCRIAAMDHALMLHTPRTSARLLLGYPSRPYDDDDFRLVNMKLVDEGLLYVPAGLTRDDHGFDAHILVKSLVR
jgi:hypothetical protein